MRELRRLARLRSMADEAGHSGSHHRAEARELPPLLEWIPDVSPHLDKPHWLAPLGEVFERAEREPVRAVVNVPPQHGKSTFVFHAIARSLIRQPWRPILYLTYSEDFATSQMRQAKPIAEAAGVQFHALGSGSLREWLTVDGGRLYATGIGGATTGRPGGLIVMDDLVKDWVQAQSPAVRQRTDDWLRSVVLTRMHPTSSAILVQTRWHDDDEAGRLIARGWEAVVLDAIIEDEAGNRRALWEAERPLAWLDEQAAQLGAPVFDALYRQRPINQGQARLFNEPQWCELSEVPRDGRVSIGIDLAYTQKTKSDFCAIVTLVEKYGMIFVAHAEWRQCRAEHFAESMRDQLRTWADSRITWHTGGVEAGSAGIFGLVGLPIDVVNAGTDLYVRSLPVSAAWTAGTLKVPRNARWANEFVKFVTSFRGSEENAPSRDIVAALGSAYGPLSQYVHWRAGLSASKRAGANVRKHF